MPHNSPPLASIAFTAPRGAQSLPGADFTELVELAKIKGFPCCCAAITTRWAAMPCGRSRACSKRDHHLDVHQPFRGRQGLNSRLPRRRPESPDSPCTLWTGIQVGRNRARHRAMYQQFKCLHPKHNIKTAGDIARDMVLKCHAGILPPASGAAEWETFLHIERCWRGNPKLR